MTSENEEIRRAILQSIRASLKASLPHDAARDQHGALVSSRKQAALPDHDAKSTLERLQRSLASVQAQCIIASDYSQATEAIERIIENEKARRVAVSDSPMARSLMRQVKADVEWLVNAPRSELFDLDMGITSAQWAIAETGTLVLKSESERHRLISLVPPAHVAIVERPRILMTLGDALTAARGQGDPDPAITFITGPSRTSDIELTLAIGVHGPQSLYVIVLG